jgi:hypothetical protein
MASNVAIAMADIDDHSAAGAIDEATSIPGIHVDALGAIDQRATQPGEVKEIRRRCFYGRKFRRDLVQARLPLGK